MAASSYKERPNGISLITSEEVKNPDGSKMSGTWVTRLGRGKFRR